MNPTAEVAEQSTDTQGTTKRKAHRLPHQGNIDATVFETMVRTARSIPRTFSVATSSAKARMLNESTLTRSNRLTCRTSSNRRRRFGRK